jgi:hypothetical protein
MYALRQLHWRLMTQSVVFTSAMVLTRVAAVRS